MSKLYNGKEHVFTTLGVATNVILKGGSGEQFQIQGTLNVVDGNNNPGSILLNGNGIGTYTTLSELSDVTLTGVLDNNVLQYDSGTSKWVNSDGRLSYVADVDTPNLTVAKNYIGVGTQYLSFVGNSIMFGTDTNFNSGKLTFITPTTLSLSPTYLKLANNYLLPTTSSLYVGNSTAGEWGGINWSNSSTLQVSGSSYINQNVTTSGVPSFTSMTTSGNIYAGGSIISNSYLQANGNIVAQLGNFTASNGGNTVSITFTVGSNNYMIKHNSSDNSFTI